MKLSVLFAIATIAATPCLAEIRGLIEPTDPMGQQTDRKLDSALTPARHDDSTPLPGAEATMDPASERDIRRSFLRIVNAGFARGGLGDLVALLTKADRQRLAPATTDTRDENDARIAAFRKSFRSKYGSDFELKEEHLKGFLTITPGSAKNTALVKVGAAEPKKNRRSEQPSPVADGASRKNSMFPEAPVTLNFVNEGSVQPAWRLNLPDTLDAASLKEVIGKVVTKLEDQKNHWPDDATELYRIATSRLVVSFTQSAFASDR